MAACSSNEPDSAAEPDAQVATQDPQVAIAQPEEPPAQTEEPDDEEEAAPPPAATAVPTPTELTNENVYRAVQDSIVFVVDDSRTTSGSGIVLDGGWIVTNAHVVNQNETVRIGRSDGTDLGFHPVHAIDWLFDLALIGPIDDEALIPLPMNTSQLVQGSRVLLLGFPDDDTFAPTPTLTEGIVSRFRTMEVGDYPFIQVDATIAPGQSGGALVNANGELIGISGLQFGSGQFGLVFRAEAMRDRVEEVLLDPAPPPAQDGDALSQRVISLEGRRSQGFLLQIEAGDRLNVLAEGESDMWLELRTLGGSRVFNDVEQADDPFKLPTTATPLFSDITVQGPEQLLGNVQPGTYALIVGTFANEPVDIALTSSQVMWEFPDSDEGRRLEPNAIVEGTFDWNRDSDTWLLDLDEGDNVQITGEAIGDTLLAVYLDGEFVVGSDDAGLGIFGTTPQVEFVAETSGTYEVEVGTLAVQPWGYLVETKISADA